METILVLVIGIFIGWNLPQPPWAKSFQDSIVDLVRLLIAKVTGRS